MLKSFKILLFRGKTDKYPHFTDRYTQLNQNIKTLGIFALALSRHQR